MSGTRRLTTRVAVSTRAIGTLPRRRTVRHPPVSRGPPGAVNHRDQSTGSWAVRLPIRCITRQWSGRTTTRPALYGTFDQSGNVWEWNDTIVSGSKVRRGVADRSSVPFRRFWPLPPLPLYAAATRPTGTTSSVSAWRAFLSPPPSSCSVSLSSACWPTGGDGGRSLQLNARLVSSLTLPTELEAFHPSGAASRDVTTPWSKSILSPRLPSRYPEAREAARTGCPIT